MLPPGFEPGSSARKAGILDRTRLREQVGRAGFEPAILAILNPIRQGDVLTGLDHRPNTPRVGFEPTRAEAR